MLLAAGCSDAIAPRRETPPPPSPVFEVTSQSTIALWGFNGTLPPQSGTTLGKEFNPENPPPGSTVLATFVWVGSTNIIDSVADFLWTGKRLGNRYTLVEYVTAGGISMATYVATNVQNYPYPKTRLGDEFVVNAYLSTPVSAGGALVSAYTGVDPTLTAALGPHHSASGSGATIPTNAHPGPISAGAGALVYGVSMTTDGAVGREAPTGFTLITNMQTESPSIQLDAEYAVEGSAATVDPTWGWSFTSSKTWIASALALNPAGSAPPPPPANEPPLASFSTTCNALTCTFTNGSTDPDGTIATYAWAFGDGASSAAQSPSHTYAAAGTYPVALTVHDNQGAGSTTSQSVTVSAPPPPPSTLALDQFNGTLNQGGTPMLIKGFNPTNPHVGDAIIATFFWQGPATITSVTDVLTNSTFTVVGNTYHLVDQVSFNGYTMATYVATNVQNFPDPNPDQATVLAVRATMSEPVTNGGIQLTAWTGVQPDFALAIGAARSASGQSAQDAIVGPGPVPVNAGALTFAVAMASAPTGRDPPSGFMRYFGSVMTDPVLAVEADYAIPAAASTQDPRWFWAFSQAGGAAVTWLATVFSLNVP